MQSVGLWGMGVEGNGVGAGGWGTRRDSLDWKGRDTHECFVTRAGCLDAAGDTVPPWPSPHVASNRHTASLAVGLGKAACACASVDLLVWITLLLLHSGCVPCREPANQCRQTADQIRTCISSSGTNCTSPDTMVLSSGSPTSTSSTYRLSASGSCMAGQAQAFSSLNHQRARFESPGARTLGWMCAHTWRMHAGFHSASGGLHMCPCLFACMQACNHAGMQHPATCTWCMHA